MQGNGFDDDSVGDDDVLLLVIPGRQGYLVSSRHRVDVLEIQGGCPGGKGLYPAIALGNGSGQVFSQGELPGLTPNPLFRTGQCNSIDRRFRGKLPRDLDLAATGVHSPAADAQ